MNVQVITRDGVPEYAVLPWAEYQALLEATGRPVAQPAAASDQASLTQLAQLRQAQGLSLEELARTVGISPAYLELIERGERDPDNAIRRVLARTLGVAGWGGAS
ncbi:helix-turn-helix transcriptional regulator [Pseudomonas sp. ABC1]|uniref:helix-turn-helix domain-containing protein n=1 Tax=Pseudomonas sp. ABC1 TaxID=2748080 RepID=UPI0015C3B5D4|nr:helix-turn-helix transcriptional regulator [Pseudomonas sp. ABC1]QLF91713.1 helix-turn-helix transcriptional regulator [Pseudomonas sp. ABC1]